MHGPSAGGATTPGGAGADPVRATVLAAASAARLATDRQSLGEWGATIESNLGRLRVGVAGEPHVRNLESWTSLVERGDVVGLKRVLTGLDRDSIEMREVSPMGGLLSQEDRSDAMKRAR